MKKLIVTLVTAALLLALAPAVVYAASTTTVEVNNGNTITLGVNGVIPVVPHEFVPTVATGGIPVAVKNLPDLGAPANGLAAFQFDFSWNKDVIRVDSVYPSLASAAKNWAIAIPPPPYTNGKVTVAGFVTGITYSTDNITLLYFGITAVGNAGDSTSINVTITTFYDRNNVTIPARPVNAPVVIAPVVIPQLLSIAVTPVNPIIALGLTQQFTATGIYTNGPANITSAVTWVSSNPTVATISTAGLATSLTPGTTNITATYGAISGSTTLTVTATYNFGGFLQPIPLPVSTFKAGSTIPVKFKLADYAGNLVSTATGTASISTSAAASAAIRYDATAMQYIANLQTPKGAAPGTYTITVSLNDGSTHSIVVTLK